MEIVIALVVLAVAVLLIIGPLRGGAGGSRSPGQASAREELEAAKEAKYREIRDAELDYRTGKLSREDWQRLDSSLRAEAVELLDRLEGLERRERGEGQHPSRLDSDES
jgi:hypothetical protein